MKLFIILTAHKAEILLREGKEEKAYREFVVDNNLSQNLLVEIDMLFGEVGVNPIDIEGVEYSAQEAGFTTTRIGQVVVDTYNFVLRKP